MGVYFTPEAQRLVKEAKDPSFSFHDIYCQHGQVVGETSAELMKYHFDLNNGFDLVIWFTDFSYSVHDLVETEMDAEEPDQLTYE